MRGKIVAIVSASFTAAHMAAVRNEFDQEIDPMGKCQVYDCELEEVVLTVDTGPL